MNRFYLVWLVGALNLACASPVSLRAQRAPWRVVPQDWAREGGPRVMVDSDFVVYLAQREAQGKPVPGVMGSRTPPDIRAGHAYVPMAVGELVSFTVDPQAVTDIVVHGDVVKAHWTTDRHATRLDGTPVSPRSSLHILAERVGQARLDVLGPSGLLRRLTLAVR